VVDGLNGFPDAIKPVVPQTQVQTCIVHLLRHALSLPHGRTAGSSCKHSADLHPGEREVAREALDAFADGPWGRKYPAIAPAWRRQWEQVIPFFAYPPQVRRIIYTTDEVDKPPAQRIACFSVVTRSRGRRPLSGR
jgi:putative transposase